MWFFAMWKGQKILMRENKGVLHLLKVCESASFRGFGWIDSERINRRSSEVRL